MCEINPKHKNFFRLEFFTTLSLTQDEWESLVNSMALAMEMKLNEDGRVRVHIHEIEDSTRESARSNDDKTPNPSNI